MNKPIEIIRQTRIHLIALTDGLSMEQLNHVPNGFNNNILWNIAHVIAAQQGVCYRRAELDMVITDKFFNTFKPDTKPERVFTIEEFNDSKQLLASTIDQLEEDYLMKKFTNYTPWVTRYGVSINSIDDAIAFLPFHEGMHFGYVMALKRLV